MLEKNQADLESLNGYIGHSAGRTVFTVRSAPVLFIAPTQPLYLRFLAALSTSRSLVVGPSVRPLVGLLMQTYGNHVNASINWGANRLPGDQRRKKIAIF